MGRLAALISWAAAADSRLVRGALARLTVRAGGLGGGMSPFLVPLVRCYPFLLTVGFSKPYKSASFSFNLS
jgi:hypothetical protein